jgi:prepilin-type N-terminal cleavage/methylation domain-containing protein/prepilin-type processing-associated H-X9-DG protein
MPRPRHPSRHDRRTGLTLPEVLVAVSVIAVLMGILLPALALLRESARKASCANNISRLATGFTVHDTSLSALPGWRNVVQPWTAAHCGQGVEDDAACVSWTVPLMAFIGEREIADWYSTYSVTRVADDARLKRVNLFLCPVVSGLEEATSPGPLSYFVNGGTGALTLTSERQVTGDGVCVDAAGNQRTQPWYRQSGGAKEYYPERMSLTEVAEGDGTSNTLLLAERTGTAAPLEVSWADHPLPAVNNSDRSVSTLHAILHSRGIHPGYGAPGGGQSAHATDNTWMKIRGDQGLRYPSSRHRDGFMTAFCDGHVTFVSNAIDEWVYTQILTSDSRPGRISLRVAMFQQRPTGVPDQFEPYIYDEHDLHR